MTTRRRSPAAAQLARPEGERGPRAPGEETERNAKLQASAGNQRAREQAKQEVASRNAQAHERAKLKIAAREQLKRDLRKGLEY